MLCPWVCQRPKSYYHSGILEMLHFLFLPYGKLCSFSSLAFRPIKILPLNPTPSISSGTCPSLRVFLGPEGSELPLLCRISHSVFSARNCLFLSTPLSPSLTNLSDHHLSLSSPTDAFTSGASLELSGVLGGPPKCFYRIPNTTKYTEVNALPTCLKKFMKAYR